MLICLSMGFPGGSNGRVCLQCRIPDILGLGRFTGEEWLPNPVFLPGELHGERSLVGYSPWIHRELDMTFTFHLFNVYIYIYCVQV